MGDQMLKRGEALRLAEKLDVWPPGMGFALEPVGPRKITTVNTLPVGAKFVTLFPKLRTSMKKQRISYITSS